MSANPNATQEIIIVKRSGEEEDHHHGGAWKIAFADFMTAMMALFLVLWLVNASSESTKQSVASYFNPVKLVDRNRSEKGLYEPSGFTELELGEKIGADAKDASSSDAESDEVTQSEFFADPERVLDEISESAPPGPVASPTPVENADAQAPETTEFVDPFQPLEWSQGTAGQGSAIVIGQPQQGGETQEPPVETLAEADTEPTNAENTDQESLAENDEGTELDQMQERLEMSLREALIAQGLAADRIEVVGQGGKVLVSISDDETEGMFAIGSAVPEPQTVNAIATIGGILARSNVNLEIEGHTDARPFAGDSDNWQLSAARAQAVLYMLLRGGLDEARVMTVGGSADRVLAEPTDPFSARNRRVDILVELVEDVQ